MTNCHTVCAEIELQFDIYTFVNQDLIASHFYL